MRKITLFLLAAFGLVLAAETARAGWGCPTNGCNTCTNNPCNQQFPAKHKGDLGECMELRWEFWTKHCPKPKCETCKDKKCKGLGCKHGGEPAFNGYGWNPYVRSPRDYFMVKP